MRALILDVNEAQDNSQPLKNLVVKGAFFVILIYLLVYTYNSGLLTALNNYVRHL